MRRTSVIPQSGCRPAMRFILALLSSVSRSAKWASAYWITSSARRRSDGGIVRPRVLAVFRLITRSNCVGDSPFRFGAAQGVARRPRQSRSR